MSVTAEAIASARGIIAPYLARTPLVRVPQFGADVYLKNETVQPTGSFKVRGAINALSAALARGSVREVVAASTGNHGSAVAYAARLLGVPARIFVPERSNPVKVARIRAEGATLVETGRDLSEAIDAAAAHSELAQAFFLHDASSPDVPAGTATIGAEIVEDLPAAVGPVDVYVPMGDTALIRGVASSLRQSGRPSRFIGVVAEKAPAYLLSWRSGDVVETRESSTIADGLAVRRPLAGNVAAIRSLVDDVVAVSEREMLSAIRRLREATGIVAEPSGAAALAAFARIGSHPSVVLVTGGNLAPDVEARLVGGY